MMHAEDSEAVAQPTSRMTRARADARRCPRFDKAELDHMKAVRAKNDVFSGL